MGRPVRLAPCRRNRSFYLEDFVPNNEALLVKDPNYWGHDERYPQNKVPYLDSIKYAIITDIMRRSTAMPCRQNRYHGPGFLMNRPEEIRKTNPEIQVILNPTTQAVTVQPRNDIAPF